MDRGSTVLCTVLFMIHIIIAQFIVKVTPCYHPPSGRSGLPFGVPTGGKDKNCNIDQHRHHLVVIILARVFGDKTDQSRPLMSSVYNEPNPAAVLISRGRAVRTYAV